MYTHAHTYTPRNFPRHAPTTCQAPCHLDAQHSAYSRGLTGARPRTSSPQEGRPHREGSWRARRISNPHKSLPPPPWRGRVLLHPEAWRPDPAMEALGKGMGPPAFGGWDHLAIAVTADKGLLEHRYHAPSGFLLIHIDGGNTSLSPLRLGLILAAAGQKAAKWLD